MESTTHSAISGPARAVAGRLSAHLRRLRADTRGVAAVEFAMILPIMFFLFVGTIEFSQALTVDRRVTQSASSTADLIARAPKEGLTTSQVDSELRIIEQLMKPYDVSPLTVRIVSVLAKKTKSGSLQYSVDWSRDNHGHTPYARNSEYQGQMPDGLLVNNESVIIAEASYNYTPLIFNYFIQQAFDLNDTFYLKPRNALCVKLEGNQCGST
jgi:Flp pilus assembly protein TadG